MRAAACLGGGIGLFVAGSWMLLNLVADREERSAPRDPHTNILIGAEARELGPDDARGAVMFVHGFAGSGNNFGEVPDAIAQNGWRVRIMRLPGHGTSPKELSEQRLDGLLRAVLREAAALRARHDRLVLVGHSLGASLCVMAAAEMPLDGIVLAAPYFGVTHRWYYGLRPETWLRMLQPVLPWCYKGRLFMQVNRADAKPQILAYTWLPPQSAQILLEAHRRANAPRLLRQVRCPVLMLLGENDAASSGDAAELALLQMESTVKRLIRLPRSNHHIFWDYDRETVKGEILAFLAGVSE